jgi:hypothetical protein
MNPLFGICAVQLDLLCNATYVNQYGDPSDAMRPEKENVMVKNYDEMQKLGQENANATMKPFVVISNGVQAIATEVADYSKKSFEEGTLAFGQLLGAKSVEKAIELQQVYFKNAYEGFVTQATKIGALYADLVKETCKPFEGYGAKITPAK